MPDPERTLTVGIGLVDVKLFENSADYQPTPFGGEVKVVEVVTEATEKQPPHVKLDVSRCPVLQGRGEVMVRLVSLNAAGNGSQMFGKEADKEVSVNLGRRLKELKPYSPTMRKGGLMSGNFWETPKSAKAYALPL